MNAEQIISLIVAVLTGLAIVGTWFILSTILPH